jgi:outer membrane protein
MNSRNVFVGFSALISLVPNAALAQDAGGQIDIPETAKIAATIKAGCPETGCSIRMTGEQLLANAEKFIAERDFDSAAPLVKALGMAPQYKLQHDFLLGYIAAESGDLPGAEKIFRGILKDSPGQTRVRLELARIMMMRGNESSADYHFRLAQDDEELPTDIAQTIRSARSIIRNSRKWNLNFDVGLAPDSNINSATSAETVNINYGPLQLPLTLDANARKQSGIGQTGGFSAGLRLKSGKRTAFLIDSDARFVNYKGKIADSIQLQLAAGPEIRVGESSSLSVQGLAEKRWYGGRSASMDFGTRVGFQKVLSAGQRMGISIDGRHTKSDISPAYTGWQIGGNATYERVISGTFIASVSLIARRDILESDAYSNSSYGINLGIGGELPLGINAGISGNISRAKYDQALTIYSFDVRKDDRYFARAYAGLRSVKLLGFSPSVDYSFSKVDSNYDLYRSTRHRVNFKLARYF